MSKLMTARYPGRCRTCGDDINVGDSIRWISRGRASHADCEDSGRVVVTRFSSGAESYRNSRGRCEDAPCCGCCS